MAAAKRTISHYRYWLKVFLDPLLWFLKALSNEQRLSVVLGLEDQRSTFREQAMPLTGPEAVDEMWECLIVVWSNKKKGSIFDLDLEYWRTEEIELILGDIILIPSCINSFPLRDFHQLFTCPNCLCLSFCPSRFQVIGLGFEYFHFVQINQNQSLQRETFPNGDCSYLEISPIKQQDLPNFHYLLLFLFLR
eukprot:TRINITY_DN12194_c0_g1_i1.p1 TRINITY_DN12194_c0_g1~~TRINITY_DN12194_c0_g1_i1.p1  ORF type:complete len:192 (+),score=8.16 TRINITY_DN12194_c0_g1_i1:382-957(+)